MMSRWLLMISMLLVVFSAQLMAAEPTAEPVNKNDLILVVGATGKTGRLVVADLQAQGFKVRAMVRDLERGKAVLGNDVVLIKADLTDKQSLSAVMEGVEAVINTAGAGLKGTGKATPEWIDYQGTVNLVELAKAAEIKKFILLSSMGVTQADHFLNKIANDVLKWKFKGEEVLRHSGLNYSIVRPGGLTNKSGDEHVVQFFQGDNKKGGPIRREDVSRLCIAALLLPEADRKTYEVMSVPGTRNLDFTERLSALVKD